MAVYRVSKGTMPAPLTKRANYVPHGGTMGKKLPGGLAPTVPTGGRAFDTARVFGVRSRISGVPLGEAPADGGRYKKRA